MKIPQIVATQEIGVQRQAEAEPNLYAAPAAALHRGAIVASGAVIYAANQIAEVEKAKYLQGVKIESSMLKSQMELHSETALQGLRLVESDPDAYSKKANAAIQESYQSAVNAAKYPETKQILAEHLGELQRTKGIEAMKYSNSLYVSRNIGLLDTNLSNLKTQGSMAPEDGGDQVKSAVDYFEDGRQAILGARTLLGEKVTADKLIAWQNDFAYQRGLSDLRKDPNADIARFQPFIKPEQYQALATHQDVLKRAVIAERDKQERKMHADLEADRKTITDEYDSRALRGDLSVEELERARQARMVIGEDYRRIYKQVSEGKDVQDMPDVANQLIMGSSGTHPSVTERQVHEARASNQISLKTAEHLLDKLRITANTLRDQGDSQLVRDHNQAEQVLRSALGIKPGIVATAMKEDPQGRLYFSGLDELTRRSRLFQSSYGGQEDPLKAMDDIGPRYNRALTQSNDNQRTEIQLSLRYPTRQALEQAYQAKQLTQAAYILELRKLSAMDSLIVPTSGKPAGTPGPAGRLEYQKPTQGKPGG